MDISKDIARKVLICVIDANPRHRAQVKSALTSFYTVADFENGAQALDALRSVPPKAVVLDEKIPPDGGMALLQKIRQFPALAHVHVILTTVDETSSILDSPPPGIDACLLKPYRRSLLLQTISQQVNKTTEEAWQHIEPLQRAALEKTLNSFHRISDLIEEGEPLPYGEVRESCEPLVEAVSRNDYKQILRGVQGHDNYSYVHSLRVATLLALFGHTIGIGRDQRGLLAVGGLLHDVGKMSIPHEILNKPGRLEGKDWETMRSHVQRTVDFLDNSPDIPHGILTIAAQHHEKLDGSGYPNGLKGGELNELARMAAIVDIFGALTDRRIYRPPLSAEEAIMLMKTMDTEIDEDLLVLFADMLLHAASNIDEA